MKMTVVLLDTNMLLLPHKHRIDVFSEIERLITGEHEVATLSTVVDELKEIARENNDDGIAAKVGLRLLTDKKVRVITSKGPVDDALVEYAQKDRATVCTNDRELKARLKKAGIRRVFMRGKTHLEKT